MRTIPSWPNYFRALAETVHQRSKDTNTNIGAVLVGENNQIISTGYNSFPAGIKDDVPARFERPEKYFWFEHAERNAIYNAAKSGVSTNGATIYLSCSCPCADCARAIINSGVKTVWMQKGDTTSNPQKWEEHSKRSLEMFNESGILIRYYEDEDNSNS